MDLRDRIDKAIARVTASKAADSVLAEIGRTHVIVERDRWERVNHALSHVQTRYDEWDNDYNHPSGLPRDTIALNTIEQVVAMIEPGDLDDAACREVRR